MGFWQRQWWPWWICDFVILDYWVEYLWWCFWREDLLIWQIDRNCDGFWWSKKTKILKGQKQLEAIKKVALIPC